MAFGLKYLDLSGLIMFDKIQQKDNKKHVNDVEENLLEGIYVYFIFVGHYSSFKRLSIFHPRTGWLMYLISNIFHFASGWKNKKEQQQQHSYNFVARRKFDLSYMYNMASFSSSSMRRIYLKFFNTIFPSMNNTQVFLILWVSLNFLKLEGHFRKRNGITSS